MRASSVRSQRETRPGSIGYVEYFQPGIRLFLGFVALVIDQHDIAAHANFVGVDALGYFELREALARPWDLPHWVDHRKERKTA